MKKFLQEFKSFAMKGNVLNLAIGVIIGGAFGKIVSSLVSDIIMPLFGLITGRVNLTDMKYVIAAESGSAKALTLNYGTFIQSVIDFLIIAFSIFMFIKLLSRFKKEAEKKEEAAAAAKPSKEELLLTEIRDLLKENKK
jgi:large conductance mechanosensitive channel